MKTCSKCKTNRTIEDFPNDKSRKDGKHPYCRACHKRYWKLKPKTKELRDYHNKISRKFQCSKYGITTEQYEKMLIAQAGLCAICRSNNQNNRLSIDHCHVTEKIRGLLCINCNTGLGKFGDSIEMLRTAIEYLEN